jgi:hypothetical protein
VQYFTFTVTAGSHVVLESYSYAGGKNAAGVQIAGGGFDPTIAVFRTSAGAPMFKANDDDFSCKWVTRDTATNVCYDIYWEATAQPTDANAIGTFQEGTYAVVLMNEAKFANDGFSSTAGGLLPSRDGHWALDIKGVDTAQMVSVNAAAPPTVGAVTPNAGTGLTQTFQYTFSDPNGFADIKTIWAQIATNTNYPKTCAINFDAATKRLYLVRDDATAWQGPITPGTSATLSNSACTISAAGSSFTGSGNNATLTVSYTFSPTYTGSKTIYSRANNKAGLDSGWQVKGTWTPQ